MTFKTKIQCALAALTTFCFSEAMAEAEAGAAICRKDTVVETSRMIPVAAEVDVVIAGGTAAGVAAAIAAKEAGASVFLAGGYPYLGEDMAGTLELECANGESATEMERLLRKDDTGSNATSYSYSYRRGFKFIGGTQFHNDAYEKLSNPTPPTTPWDSVLATNEISVSCKLAMPQIVHSVEVTVIENADCDRPACISVDHRGAITSKTARGPLTGRIYSSVLNGERKKEMVELIRDNKSRPLGGDAIRAGEPEAKMPGVARANVASHQIAVTYRAVINCKVDKMDILVVPAEGAACQLLSRIRFNLASSTTCDDNPSPLKVKKTFDRMLLDRKIPFITGSPTTDLLSDESGNVAGIVIANRSGRQAIRAKCVIDATRYGAIGRLGKPVPGIRGKTIFSRTIVSGARPNRQGMQAQMVSGGQAIEHVTTNPSWGEFAALAVTGRIWRCTFDIDMPDGSYASFAAAEWQARQLTQENSVFDAADQLRLVSPFQSPPKRKFMWCVPDNKRLSERIAAAGITGREAAEIARKRAMPSGVTVEAKETKKDAAGERVMEILDGLRSYDAYCQRHGGVASPTRELPVLGGFDVVVVGGGTAGTAAAIAAARSGAKTLLIEYLHVLGGVSTDGMITGYYDGNRCGFTEEFNKSIKERNEKIHVFRVSGAYHDLCAKAGVTVWHGAFGAGACMKGNVVSGVTVVTPQGRGIVRAKCVIDATGNADVAAAAGAQTTFIDAQELALQSAGAAPHRLGRGGVNSDFGYVNDPDAWDMWLFGIRARAGAPNPWDIQQLADSRERRRIIPDYMITGWDVVYGRRFPDTINQSYSRQDSHGFIKDEYGYIAEVDGLGARFVNIPLRSYLPRGISALAVIGLGKGVARDVVPMTRMRADMMNEGYAIGLIAADAAGMHNGDYRKTDVKALQARLIEKGNLKPEVAAWTDDPELTDERLKNALATIADGYRGSGYALRYPERSLPFLRERFKSATTAESKQAYAIVLGLLGDPTGAEHLAALVEKKIPFARLRKGKSYGGEAYDQVGLAIALGRTKAKCAVKPLVNWMSRIDPASAPLVEVRAVTLGLEALGSPDAAPALADALSKPEVGGWARRDIDELAPLGGYGVGPEMERCLRELAIARALFACGDYENKARETLTGYAKDPRGTLAEHANAVLKSR